MNTVTKVPFLELTRFDATFEAEAAEVTDKLKGILKDVSQSL